MNLPPETLQRLIDFAHAAMEKRSGIEDDATVSQSRRPDGYVTILAKDLRAIQKLGRPSWVFTSISISMDGVWAGSGKLVDGRIEDCGAQFCDDNDESIGVYDAIEAAIKTGKTHIKAAFRGDHKRHEITWTITEPS